MGCASSKEKVHPAALLTTQQDARAQAGPAASPQAAPATPGKEPSQLSSTSTDSRRLVLILWVSPWSTQGMYILPQGAVHESSEGPLRAQPRSPAAMPYTYVLVATQDIENVRLPKATCPALQPQAVIR